MIIFVKILIFSKFMVKIGGSVEAGIGLKKPNFFYFLKLQACVLYPPQVSLAYHYYLKSYGMCMLKLLKRHHLFCFFLELWRCPLTCNAENETNFTFVSSISVINFWFFSIKVVFSPITFMIFSFQSSPRVEF